MFTYIYIYTHVYFHTFVYDISGQTIRTKAPTDTLNVKNVREIFGKDLTLGFQTPCEEVFEANKTYLKHPLLRRYLEDQGQFGFVSYCSMSFTQYHSSPDHPSKNIFPDHVSTHFMDPTGDIVLHALFADMYFWILNMIYVILDKVISFVKCLIT